MNAYVLLKREIPSDIIRLINKWILYLSTDTIIFYFRTKCVIKTQICWLFIYEKSLIRRDGQINVNRLPLLLKAFKAAERWISGADCIHFWTKSIIFFKRELLKITYNYSSDEYEYQTSILHDSIHNIGLKFNINIY